MIDAQKHKGWQELESKLRPFFARRLSSATDIDDLLQEVFLRIQRGLKTLKQETKFGSWVYQIARNILTDHTRQKMRHPLVYYDESKDRRTEQFTESEEENIEKKVANSLLLLIKLLPAHSRQAIIWTELEGISQKEAARMAGVPLSTMKSRVQRGREKLRRLLEDCCQIAIDARKRVVSCQPRSGSVLPDCSC